MDPQGRVALLGFGEPEAKLYLEGVPQADLDRSWQLITPDGRRLMAGAAVVELGLAFPRTRRVAATIRTLRLTWVVGIVYWIVSAMRTQLGRFVDQGPGPKRLPGYRVGDRT